MRPTDLRNATWADVQSHVTADMWRVHAAWREHGPGTTDLVAQKSGISLLTLRPRTTDLYKLGLVEITGRHGTSGVYVYVSEAEAQLAQAWRTDRRSHRQEPRATTGTAPIFKNHREQVAWAAAIMGREARRKRRRVEPMQQQLELLSA